MLCFYFDFVKQAWSNIFSNLKFIYDTQTKSNNGNKIKDKILPIHMSIVDQKLTS